MRQKDLPRVMLVAKMMGKDFDDLADIKGEHKDKSRKNLNLLSKQGEFHIREPLNPLILLLTKERLSVLPDFLVPDVQSWFVQSMVQIRLRQEPLR